MFRRGALLLLVLIVIQLPRGADALTHSSYRGLSIAEPSVVDVTTPGGVVVNTRNGNLVIARALWQIPGKGLPVEMSLTYNSTARSVASAFGLGWTFSYAIRNTREADGSVNIIWGDGRQDRFTFSGGVYTAPAGIFMTLTEPTVGDFTLTTKRGIVFRFADPSHQRVTSIRDPTGNTLSLTYDATTKRLTSLGDPSGRSTTFAYDAMGRCTQIVDPNLGNRTYGFAYDTTNRLTSITNPLGQADAFAYDGENLPTAVTDRRLNTATLTYATPAWSAATRLPSTVAKGGRTVSFAYNDTTRTTTFTDGRGNPWAYAYDVTGLIATFTTPGNAATTYTWDAAKNLLIETGPMGDRMTYTYDANDNQTLFTDRGDAGWQSTYNALDEVATTIDARGTQAFAYDLNGNATSVTDRRGN